MPTFWPFRQTPSEQEIAIAAAVVRSSRDPRAELLVKQFAQGHVQRMRTGTSLTIKVLHTSADLLIDLDQNVTSVPVRLINSADGQTLEFTVLLRRGGFFGSLVGTSETSWPKRWAIDPAELAALSFRLVSLGPEPEDDGKIARLVGLPDEASADLRRRASRGIDAISDLEQREGAPLPPGCRELLGLTDGITIGAVSVLGVSDLYTVDLGDGVNRWLVGSGDTGAQYLGSDEGIFRLPVPRSEPDEMRLASPSYLAWVRALVLESADSQP